MTKTFPFFQIDAFADHPFEGNPCAVILDSDAIHDAQMQAIAREMNYSETAFVGTSPAGGINLRYFTPVEEIPMAGHPTIATVHALWCAQRIKQQSQDITIQTKAGPITVGVDATDERAPLITMQQRPPVYLRRYDWRDAMTCFGLDADDVLSEYPLQTVSTGTPNLMVPLRSRAALDKVVLNPDHLTAWRDAGDFFCAHLFCRAGYTEQGAVAARNFAPPPDAVEDAFTGSGMGAMGCYMAQYRLHDQTSFWVEQGHGMQRPGRGRIDVDVEDGDAIGVRLTGRARLIVEGTLRCDEA